MNTFVIHVFILSFTHLRPDLDMLSLNTLYMCVLFTCLARVTYTSSLPIYKKTADLRSTLIFSALTTRSKIECCLACSVTPGCSFVNYHRDSRSCELCDVDAEGTGTSALAWDIYVQVKALQCEPGWTVHDNSCYLLSKEIRTWPSSEEACSSHNAGCHLAAIQSQDTLDFLRDTYLSELGLTGVIWIGGISDESGTLRWPDQSLVIGGFENWSPFQPDNSGGCVAVVPITFKWDDATCWYFLWSLCECKME